MSKQEESQVVITINDIRNAVEIFDVCAERGAFRGPELQGVGALRTKFASFVASRVPQPEEAAEGEDAEEESEEAESATEAPAAPERE